MSHKVSKTRRINVGELQNEYLKTGWLMEAIESGVINSYVTSDKPKESKGYWIAEQVGKFSISTMSSLMFRRFGGLK